MKRMVSEGLAAILAVGGISSAFAADPKTAVQALTPTQIQTAGGKVQKIAFLQGCCQRFRRTSDLEGSAFAGMDFFHGKRID